MAGAYGNVGAVFYLTLYTFVTPSQFFFIIAAGALLSFIACFFSGLKSLKVRLLKNTLFHQWTLSSQLLRNQGSNERFKLPLYACLQLPCVIARQFFQEDRNMSRILDQLHFF